MFSLKSIKKVCVTGMVSSMVLMALTAPGAKAVVLDSNVYSQYATARSTLLIKESSLLKDYDALQKQLDLMNRQNIDRSLDPQIKDLSKSLDQTYFDLREVRQDIKLLERTVL